jgi:hypothetical protein
VFAAAALVSLLSFVEGRTAFMLPRSNQEAVVPKTKPKVTKTAPVSAIAALPFALDTEEGRALVRDLCRYQEKILTEKQVKRTWKFDEATWNALGGADGDEVVRAVEAETIRRVRDGSAKREKSQLLVTKAPDVLGGIMMDDSANPRHRIDSAKELNAFASNGPAEAAAQDRFIITINLGTDADGKPVIEHFDKPLAAIDVSPNTREEIEW